jgi:hypothetical protein
MRRKHKALLIGINDYNPSGLGGPDLAGPVNDVIDMRDALAACGFKEAKMQILLNECATKDNILNRVSWLLSDNEEGDCLVFYFAGHGSNAPRPNVNGLNVPAQVISPYHSSGAITIEELEQRFANLQTNVHLEVFMDCCHSGPPRVAGNFALYTKKMTPRFILPPTNFTSPQPMNKRCFFQPGLVVSPKVCHAHWAACKIDQQAHEIPFESRTEGIFTYHLCSILRSTKGNIKRGPLELLLATAVQTTSGYMQTPQLRVQGSAINDFIFS